MKPITVRSLVLAIFLTAVTAMCIQAQQDSTINDKELKVVHFEDLLYPTIAHSANVAGVVVVRVKFNDEGNVTEALALSGNGHLIENSLANARKWRFEPNSRKVAILVYDFRIEGICHPGGSSSQLTFYPPNFASITGCAKTVEP